MMPWRHSAQCSADLLRKAVIDYQGCGMDMPQQPSNLRTEE
jgi:hypothetical protein